MRRIPLRKRDGTVRDFALVDDADYEALSGYRWCLRVGLHGNDYAQRGIHGVTTILMHRQIMGFPNGKIDHRDGNGLNNQRSNLRLATTAENAQNRRGADRGSRTGLRGVSPYRGRYRAQAQANGVNHRLGVFDTPEAAFVAVTAFWEAIGVD
jgi:hypothetical protein